MSTYCDKLFCDCKLIHFDDFSSENIKNCDINCDNLCYSCKNGWLSTCECTCNKLHPGQTLFDVFKRLIKLENRKNEEKISLK